MIKLESYSEDPPGTPTNYQSGDQLKDEQPLALPALKQVFVLEEMFFQSNQTYLHSVHIHMLVPTPKPLLDMVSWIIWVTKRLTLF